MGEMLISQLLLCPMCGGGHHVSNKVSKYHHPISQTVAISNTQELQ
jgi:hypothetical protein